MLGLEGRKTVTRSPTALGGKTQAKPRWKNSPELRKEELKMGPQVRVSKEKLSFSLSVIEKERKQGVQDKT